MLAPEPLLPGDAVALLSTARAVSPEEMAPAKKILADWGYEPLEAPNLYERKHQFAGTPRQRSQDFEWALKHPRVKAILCARGGYGSVQILDHFDPKLITQHPKWLVGFSDVTVLHNLFSRLGIASIHGPMALNWATTPAEPLAMLHQALTGQAPTIRASPHPLQINGEAQGIVTGGNLSMVYSQCGSPTALDTQGAILFLEDLDEYLYHMDRMMYNLHRNGYLQQLAGVLVGSLSDMNDNDPPFGEEAEEILHRHLAPLGIPVALNVPAGHLPEHYPLIMGGTAQMKVQPNVTKVLFSNYGRT